MLSFAPATAAWIPLFFNGGGGASISGLTEIWSQNFYPHGTINSGNPLNFTSVEGSGLARPVGPRDSATLDTVRNGNSLRVAQGGINPGDVVWRGKKTFTCPIFGFFGGWFFARGLPTETNYKRVLSLYGSDGTTFLYSASVSQRASDNFLRIRSENVSGTGDVFIDGYNQWTWLQLVWHAPDPAGGTGTKSYELWYMRLGDANPILISSGSLGAVGTIYVPTQAWAGAVHSDGFGAVQPWYGALGRLSVFEADSLANARLYPSAFIERPIEKRNPWHVHPTTGMDSNAGHTLADAWRTWSKVTTETVAGTPLPGRGWLNESGARTGLSTITDETTAKTWYAQWGLGNRPLQGDRVLLYGTTADPLRVVPADSQLTLEQFPGVSAEGTDSGNYAVVSARYVLTGAIWAQGTWSGTHPNVWKHTISNMRRNDTGALVEEGGVFTTPVAAATEAAALTLLNATAGRCWTDTTGIYLHAFGSTNPNTDGKTRTCGVPFSVSGTSAGMISIGDGEIRYLKLDVGPCASMAVGIDPEAVYCWSASTGQLAVVSDIRTYGGTKHSGGLVGNGATGACIRRNWVMEAGCAVGGYTADVQFSGYTAGVANIHGIWENVDTEPGKAYQLAGAAPADDEQIGFFTSHGSGATGDLFRLSRWTNCTLVGNLNFSLHHDGAVELEDSIYGSIDFDSTITVDRCKHLPRIRPYVGASGSVFTNSIVRDYTGLSWGTANICEAAITFNFCTIDFSDYLLSGVESAWFKTGAGAPLSLTMTNCRIITNGGSAPLTRDTDATDTIDVDNSAFMGHSNPTVMISHNPGSGAVNYLFSEAQAAGHINAASVASAAAGSDESTDYAVEVGSVVVGIAIASANFADYTGTIFALRDDAGAREFGATIVIEMQTTHSLPRVNIDGSRAFNLNLNAAVEYIFEETEVT